MQVQVRPIRPCEVVRNERALASDTARFERDGVPSDDLSDLAGQTDLAERNGIVRNGCLAATKSSRARRQIASRVRMVVDPTDGRHVHVVIAELQRPRRSSTATTAVTCTRATPTAVRRGIVPVRLDERLDLDTRTDVVRRHMPPASNRAALRCRSASRYALASRIGEEPSDRMSKNPTSCVEPNRFFSARRMRTPDERSPSNSGRHPPGARARAVRRPRPPS